MSAVARSAAERKADRRREILDAALELFVERGFHGTAVPEIAQRAGVGLGTIYRYFESKEQLVNELYRNWKSLMGAAIAQGTQQAAPRQQFHAMWAAMIGFVRAHPQGFAFVELHHHAPYLDADSRAHEERLHGFAVALVRHAQGEGRLRQGDPEILMALVIGAFTGLVRFAREGRLVLDDAASDVAEQACWDLVRA
ncbi:MAG: TetR family transcriptional regulator [Nannocystaceae bacterium]|nr:TetR family transcriptional regulator [Nannocystaceae bacterium]